jgi:uracil-DNA glycosylase
MAGPVLSELLPRTLPERWAEVVGDEGLEILSDIGGRLDHSPAQKAMMTPLPESILQAFATPPHAIRALILGQDPYPGAGHATGLAFSVGRGVHPLPPSLRNIRDEYSRDLGLPLPAHGDLSRWTRHGVLLLNRHLTTLVGSPGAHRSLGWSRFTDLVVGGLVARNHFFIPILWGREAQELAPLLGPLPRIESAHPSPLSARLGFFGSRPFTRANRLLEERNLNPIDWGLDKDD